MRNLRFSIDYNPAMMSYGFWIFSTDPKTIATEMVWEEFNLNDNIYRDPLMRISEEQAHELMNELWRAGVRPKETASDSHLDDLRQEINFLKVILTALINKLKWTA